MQKSMWYKSKKREDLYAKTITRVTRRLREKDTRTNNVEHKSVLFVEHTPKGELSKRLRELITRLAPILGFNIKVVERVGGKLKDRFSQAKLWEGADCGRDSCVTCHQGAEFYTPCTRRSAVYENTCALCNEGASGKKEIQMASESVPSLYVGETSRTIQERALEHWKNYRGSSKEQQKSHIFKHQELHHGGAEARFIMRAISFHKSALSRQTAEAVRIRRRGGEGSVLNSRSEYNRCYIPRLCLVEEDIVAEMERQEEDSIKEASEGLGIESKRWEKDRAGRRARSTKLGLSLPEKRHQDRDQRASKRRKHDLLVGWGERVEYETEMTGAQGKPDLALGFVPPAADIILDDDKRGDDRGRDDEVQRDDHHKVDVRIDVDKPMVKCDDDITPDGINDDKMKNRDENVVNNIPVVKVGDDTISDCVINKRKLRCEGHGCSVKKAKVSSKKWGWLQKQMKYGYIHSQTTKYICTGRNIGLVALRKSPAVYTCTGNKSVQIAGDISLGTQDYWNNGEESESPVQIVKVNGTS